ncbi:MAG: tetratricopeptide repeat protein [Nitrospirales bacterium]
MEKVFCSQCPLPEVENNFWYISNESDTVFIFVHGIFSTSQTAWLHDSKKGPYWPDLVSQDHRLQSPAVYMAGYSTSLTSGDFTIKDAARAILDALQRVDPQGRQPPLDKGHLIFLCHSTGGIVIRYLLERNQHLFRDKAVGLVLLASPSLGSVYANKLKPLAKFYNQQLGLQLQWRGESLADLDDRFKDLVHEKRIPRLTGVEAYEHYFIMRKQCLPGWLDRMLPNRRKLVDSLSAGRYFGAPRLLPNTDHSSAVKPDSRDHPSHQLLVTFYGEFLKFLNHAGTPQVEAIVNAIEEKYQQKIIEYQERERVYNNREQDLRNTLKSAVVALAKKQEEAGALPNVKEAFKKLAVGDTEYAEAIFREILSRKIQEGAAANKEAAEAARHLGALAFLHNTQNALEAYQEAVRLDNQNAEGWNQLGHLLIRVGKLSDCEKAYQQVLQIAKNLNDLSWEAASYVNLGNVYLTRSALDGAEKMYQKGLELFEALGKKEGLADTYTNLGVVYKVRGDLDRAEEVFRKSLELDQIGGRKKGLANTYGNLANVYLARKDLNGAEAWYKKSLKLNEDLGQKVGIAKTYTNLGVLYRTRGEDGLAEDMFLKGLELNEGLGRMEGVAGNSNNLGLVYLTSKKFDQAEQMFRKSLDLAKAHGWKGGEARSYANLGLLWLERGDLDLAEELLNESLELNETLGRKDSIASIYDDLGGLYQKRGNLDQAKQFLEKSLILFKEIGAQNKINYVQRRLDELGS